MKARSKRSVMSRKAKCEAPASAKKAVTASFEVVPRWAMRIVRQMP